MQQPCAEVESCDEYDEWETLPEVNMDGDLEINEWFRLSSSASSFIRKVTESIDSEKSVSTEKTEGVVDCHRSSGVELTFSQPDPIPDEDHAESIADNSDNKQQQPASSERYEENKPNDDDEKLPDEVELRLEKAMDAWMLRHIQLSGFAWCSVPGIVCVLSIALFGISHYIYIHQYGNYSSFHVLTPSRPRNTRQDVCRWTNDSFIDAFGMSSSGDTEKNKENGLHRPSMPSCSKLESLYIDARKQNAQLKRIVKKLQRRLTQMSKSFKHLVERSALIETILTTVDNLNFSETRNDQQQGAETKESDSSKKLRNTATQLLNMSELSEIVDRLNLVISGDNSQKLPKQVLMITLALSSSIRSLMSSLEKNIRKFNHLSTATSLGAFSSSFKSSHTIRRQDWFDDESSSASVTKSKKKKKSNGKNGNKRSKHGLNWLLDAQEQRKALRGMPYLGESQNPSWMVRRWNKRSSLRQKYA